MTRINRILLIALTVSAVAACGKSEKSDQEIQKTLQEGMQKERQLYEGMQKSVENLEKSVQEQQEKGAAKN